MLGRLLAYAIGGVVVLFLLGISTVNFIQMSELFRGYRNRRAGIKNAKAHEAFLGECCEACRRPVIPQIDLYDSRRKRWIHKRCYVEIMKEIQ
jgi:hypothetical protein